MDTVAATSFASLLRRYRLAAGLTQEGLAERANLSARAVSDLERGLRTTPRKDTIDLLADALDLGPSDRDALHAAVSRRRTLSSHSAVSSLPAELTPLIGREHDEAQAVHLLRWQGVRLLTLTGPGGVGKTRLAIRVAHSLSGDVTGSVTFVPLASVADPALVPATLATALKVSEGEGRSVEAALIARLQDEEHLLFLDNVEHLLSAAPFLSRLLSACSGVTLLVTSRSRLHLQAEQELEILPLAAPAPSSLPSPAHAARSPAVTLFVQRARAVRPDFRLTDDTALTVAEICWRLDGLPLAIELAAARIKLFPPRTLLQQLAHPLAVLTGGAADRPVRQQTLRTTIDWSSSLLSPQEQALFARLSVFAGGCTFEAVEAVCNREGDLDLLEGLASLVDKSLVRQEGEEARFGMLETIRQYAAETLVERGERDVIRQRHAEYFVLLAEKEEPEHSGPEQARQLAVQEREHDNFRAALRWCLETRSDLGLRIATNLSLFWDVRGYLSEGRRWLEAVLALPGHEEDAYLRSWALSATANLAHRQADFRRATELHEEALQVRREAGDISGVAASLYNLARIARVQGEYERAEELLEESLQICREIGKTRGIAMALNGLGLVMQLQGEYERAKTFFEDFLQLTQDLGDTRGVAFALCNLAALAEEDGDHERAKELYPESLRLAGDLGERTLIATILFGLSAVAAQEQHHERAVQLLGAAITLSKRIEMAVDPGDQQRMETVLRKTEAALSAGEREAAWNRGAAMTVEEAVEYALAGETAVSR